MVWKLQSYKKCVNLTCDNKFFCNTGVRTSAPNSFGSLRAMKEGPINRDPIFLEIGTKSNRNSGSPKQGPNNAHLVEYLNMGTQVLIQIETHR